MVSACALAPGEFAQTGPEPVVLTGVYVEHPAGAPVEANPVVAVQAGHSSDQPPLLPVAASEPLALQPQLATATASVGYPDINAPPPEPSSKLLSPEEKARVVAELEALAVGQGQPSPAAKAKCDEHAAEVLDPAERLKSDLNQQKC